MDDFIAAQIQSVLRTPNVPLPKPAGCLIVKKIAPVSVAARLGVAEKDLLAFVDGAPAARLDPHLYRNRVESRAYAFYSRPRHELVEAVVTGIETGVLLAPTMDAIKARFDTKKPDYDALEALWEARDWPTLEALTTESLRLEKTYRGTPVFLFLGAALHEQKRHQEAAPIVAEYLRETARSWTMNFTGIALLYQGLELARRGERDGAAALLSEAWRNHKHARIADAVETNTGQRPKEDPPHWVGKTFPCDYALPRLEAGPGTVSLLEAVSQLQPGQLLAVCLLASYRGNGPYNDFMGRYDNYARFFSRYLCGLHVVTSEPQRQPDRSWYYANEDRARAEGLPFEVVLDADGRVTGTLAPTSSPFILLLDREKQVLYEGDLESVDLWNALAPA
jgi:hypothetical protein